MEDRSIDREWKKGSAELLLLSLLETMPRHGYEIGKLIEQRSEGALRFHAASLYPLLYPPGEARLDSRPMGGEERPAPAALLPADGAGTESAGFPAAGLADVRRSHQPHHGSRKCLIGTNRFASNWRT
jgi:hypothetical protein